jgi:tRNA modification GTPase
VAELINAKSKYSIQYSYNLLSGGMKSLINPVIDKLIDISSTVEAFIEFPEEDLDTDELTLLFQSVDDISFSINKLVNAYRIVNSYRTGFSVVIVGKPNVGKSSLLNFLLSHERSIVSEVPGTTRDYITEYADLDGIPIKLIDTAGIRMSEDPLEQAGISRSLELIEKADLVVALFDASSFDDEDRYLFNLISNKDKVIFVNKSDLNRNVPVSYDLSFSLKYQKDTEKIIPFLKSRLMPADSESASLQLMINERHRQLFIAILDHLLALKSALLLQDFDIASFHIGEALGLLHEITGEHYTEDILNNIFEKFCIGK